MKKDKSENIKILATVGPASLKEFIIRNMDVAGVDIFRINLSHTKIKDLPAIIKNLQKWTEKPICLDTEGAQIRTGKIKNGQTEVKNNDILFLTSAGVLGDKYHIPLYPIAPHKFLQLGDIISIDFLSVIVQIIQIKGKKVCARVLSGGRIGSNKGVNISGRQISLSPFTEKDSKALELSKKFGLSHFALSFASRKEDVEQFKKFFHYPIFAISKIENRAGLINLEDICRISNAILIDRGDLSREVPLQKIAFAQKHIVDTANRIGVPVYVATNLLENMIDNFEPTRAEINDITSSLFSGVNGLVLAAETAIGKHPVQCVRMVAGIKKTLEKYSVSNSKDFLNSIYEYNLVEPHGGILVQNFMDFNQIKNIEKLPKIDIDDRILSDVVQIAEGTYSPLRGFMTRDELFSVLNRYKLPNGVIWTMPIIFQADKKDISFNKKDTIALRRVKDKNLYAIMKVSDIWKIDLSYVAKKWFGTDDLKHPGVSQFAKRGDYIIGGEIFLLRKPPFFFKSYSLTPFQTRQIFKDRGWQKIVGFHTRNIIHRGHEFIQKEALKMVEADALFISPVIGQKKEKDFSAEAILKSYELMIKNNYYDPYPALIGAFNTYSRYSGPREAVFTALCRKNFGCSHFIIGRDHTGVGNYYASDASQKLFKKLGDLGIKLLMFKTVYFCKACRKITDNCKHGEEKRISLSGTSVRKHLLSKLNMPKYLVRKEISKFLQEMHKKPKNKIFEGNF